MHLTMRDRREAHLLEESVLPVTKKERRGEGKSSIGPGMKNKGRKIKKIDAQFSKKCFFKVCIQGLVEGFIP